MRRQRGFTLVELMITVAIVGVLVSMAVPVRELIVKREQERELRTALREIRSALDAYKRAVDEGKIQADATGNGYPKLLDDLANGVDNITSPERQKLYFLRRVPRDPFNTDATLPAASTWGKRSYASAADDPQEGDDVFDVFSPSQGRGINGVPYRDW